MVKLRKYLILLAIPIIVGILLYLFRIQLLQFVGNFLIKEDTTVKVDAAYILSGNNLERSMEAAELWKMGYFPAVYPMGANINGNLEIIGQELADAQLIQLSLIQLGVAPEQITIIEEGTSTLEESEAILGNAKARGYKRIMIITSKFHTRRTRGVFRKKFEQAGINVFIKGANPIHYELDRWWEAEEGLIFVNNEYVKLLYYALMY